MPICKRCGNKFKNRIKIDGKLRNVSKRSFCLICSPFGMSNTRDLTKEPFDLKERQCIVCKNRLPLNCFYKKKRGHRQYQTTCKECFKKQVMLRRFKNKQKAVDYLGGKCKKCGYGKCINALEFHHRDTKTKEVELAIILKSGFDKIKKELDKCVLLCCRCHRELIYKDYRTVG